MLDQDLAGIQTGKEAAVEAELPLSLDMASR